MNLTVIRRKFTDFITQTPKKYAILVGVGFFLALYVLTFVVPKPVVFSYSGDNCIRRISLFPQLLKQEKAGFELSHKGIKSVGSLEVLATRVCFKATEPPKAGSSIVAEAPLGVILGRTTYNITVPSAPKAKTETLKAPVPATKPLTIKLSSSDRVYTYYLKGNDDITRCTPTNDGVSCDPTELRFKQSASYKVTLERWFDNKVVETPLSTTIDTLKAVSVTSGTLTNKQVVYDKPTSFTFNTDKPLRSTKVALENAKDGSPVKNVVAKVSGKTLTVSLAEQLARENAYRLRIASLEATDGSNLIEPMTVEFAVSGGPKVASVNVGTSKVDRNANIILTFDQPISDPSVVAKYISFTGGTAVVSRITETQIAVKLSSLPLCQAFSITVLKDFPSKYSIATKSDWKFSSRTICHTTGIYGYSLKGRPLVAYYFGASGPVTMYVGAIHGNESSSSVLMKSWIDELEANPAKLSGKRVVVVPTTNPDGVAAGTRTNSRGVNLSRNFPTSNWTSDINDTDGKHIGGGGSAPLSEPESKALAVLTSQLSPRLLLSFHAVGNLVIGDPGGLSATMAAKYASMVGYRNATGTSSSTFDYDITGAYEDWSYRNMGIQSMVIELGSYTYASIGTHRQALWAML